MHAAVLSATRVIQGRLNDLSMLAAAHAKRSPDGGYTPEASAALASIGRFKRLFIIVFYATVSRAHAPLRSAAALEGLRSRGVVDDEELSLLLAAPAGRRHHAVMGWMHSAFVAGASGGIFRMPDVMHYFVVDKFCLLRGAGAGLADKLVDRVPLA